MLTASPKRCDSYAGANGEAVSALVNPEVITHYVEHPVAHLEMILYYSSTRNRSHSHKYRSMGCGF